MTHGEQKEDIWRITAQYVAQFRSGHRPQLRTYLAQYPQYVSEIADFVAYYQAFEAPLEDDEDGLAYISSSQNGASVLARTLQRLQASSDPLDSLLSGSSTLAQELDLSEDLLLLLERRLLLEQTLPELLVEKLAFVLHQPKQAIRSYLRRPPASEKHQIGTHLRLVAEEPGSYGQNGSTQPARSFLQALDESVLATTEQKQRWRTIVERDQEEKNAQNSLS